MCFNGFFAPVASMQLILGLHDILKNYWIHQTAFINVIASIDVYGIWN